MIPSKPPPSFNKPDQWSSQFIDFVTRCLVKNPEERATASQLLQHDFIRIQARQPEILADIIREAQDMREKLAENAVVSNWLIRAITPLSLPITHKVFHHASLQFIRASLGC